MLPKEDEKITAVPDPLPPLEEKISIIIVLSQIQGDLTASYNHEKRQRQIP